MPAGRGRGGGYRAPTGFYGRNVVGGGPPDRTVSFYGQGSAAQALEPRVATAFIDRRNVDQQNYTWSKAHMLVDDNDRKKFSPNIDPLEQEDKLPFMQGWGAMAADFAMVKLRDEIEALRSPTTQNADGTVQRREPDNWELAQLQAYAKEVVKGKKRHLEARFHNEFANRFREWIRGNGSPQEYEAAGMMSYVGDNSKRNKNTPISDHDSVISYLEDWQKRVIDYDTKKAKMKLRMGRGGKPGEAASIEDLWKYYKFVVYGLPAPGREDDDDTLELFTQPLDNYTTINLDVPPGLARPNAGPPPQRDDDESKHLIDRRDEVDDALELDDPGTVTLNSPRDTPPPPPKEDRPRVLYKASEKPAPAEESTSAATEPIEKLRQQELQRQEEKSRELDVAKEVLQRTQKDINDLKEAAQLYSSDMKALMQQLKESEKLGGQHLKEAAEALKYVTANINAIVPTLNKHQELAQDTERDIAVLQAGGDPEATTRKHIPTPDSRIVPGFHLPADRVVQKENRPHRLEDDVSTGASPLSKPYNLMEGKRDRTPPKVPAPNPLRRSIDTAVSTVAAQSAAAIKNVATAITNAVSAAVAAPPPAKEKSLDELATLYSKGLLRSSQMEALGPRLSEVINRAEQMNAPPKPLPAAPIDTSIPVISMKEWKAKQAEAIQKQYAEAAAKAAPPPAPVAPPLQPYHPAPVPAVTKQQATPYPRAGVSLQGFLNDGKSVLPDRSRPPLSLGEEGPNAYSKPLKIWDPEKDEMVDYTDSEGAIFRRDDRRNATQSSELIARHARNILGKESAIKNDIFWGDALDASDEKMIIAMAQELRKNKAAAAGPEPPEWHDTDTRDTVNTKHDSGTVDEGLKTTIAESIRQGRNHKQIIEEYEKAQRDAIAAHKAYVASRIVIPGKGSPNRGYFEQKGAAAVAQMPEKLEKFKSAVNKYYSMILEEMKSDDPKVRGKWLREGETFDSMKKNITNNKRKNTIAANKAAGLMSPPPDRVKKPAAAVAKPAPAAPTVTVQEPPPPVVPKGGRYGNPPAPGVIEELNASRVKGAKELDDEAGAKQSAIAAEIEAFSANDSWGKAKIDKAVTSIMKQTEALKAMKEKHESFKMQSPNGSVKGTLPLGVNFTRAAKSLIDYINFVLRARGDGNRYSKTDGLPSLVTLKKEIEDILKK